MSFVCEFCNKDFSTKGNLTLHQKRAKFCLAARGLPINTISSEIKCQYCPKIFSSKQMCKLHEKKCNNKTINEIQQETSLKDQEIMFLKKQLEDKNKEIDYFKQELDFYKQKLGSIALEGVKKPTTTNNTSQQITNILTPLDLNEEKIKTIVENHLDETYFLDAQKGVAKFCFDKLIQTEDGKRRLVCSDPVRERYRYIDEEGNLQEDIQASRFIEKVAKPIIDASKKVHDDLKDKYSQIKKDIKRGTETEISDYLIDIKEKHAEQCLIDIHDIPFESRNRKFRKVLAQKSNI